MTYKIGDRVRLLRNEYESDPFKPGKTGKVVDKCQGYILVTLDDFTYIEWHFLPSEVEAI